MTNSRWNSSTLPRVLMSASLAVAVLGNSSVFAQSPITRDTPAAGAIVGAKGGEELQFPRATVWNPAVVKQDVIGGDTLRTGEIGTLGILFADQTTIRVGRQSTLVVNEIARGDRPTQLTLPGGTVWARASRGGTSVEVKTPAASAAIRGTDWSLTVIGDRTSLIVLEGTVEFSNPQGSVTVRQGEAASARIGERPTKTVLVRPKDREQMLFYLDLRGLFRALPASPLEGRAARDARERLLASNPDQRTAEDWLTLAELAQTYDGSAASEAALETISGHRLTPSQTGRVAFLRGLIAGERRDYANAAKWLRASISTIERGRRSRAICAYEAASVLADPKRPIRFSSATDADARLCNSMFAGFKGTLDDAARILSDGYRGRQPDQRSLLLEAQLALLLDRRDELRKVVAQMQAQDELAPETLLAAAYLKSSVDNDQEAAVRLFERGTSVAPGNSDLWNGLGLAQSARDANKEAEAAFRKAIEADPQDPVAYSNLAILLLDQSRIAEAEALIEHALRLDPSFYAAYIAKGRALLQSNREPEALEQLLAGSAANPAYAQGLLALAIANYERGDLVVAEQALENADRLDPSDPVTAIAQTAVALDQYQADAAISHAREAMRRYQNRGGDFAALATTRTGGSYLGQAYRFLGLNEWARFYSERVADAFTATSYFDQAIAARHTPLFARPTIDRIDGSDATSATSNLALQGLFLDPLAVASRIGRVDLLRRPFIDAEVSAGVVRQEGQTGWRQDVNVQAFSNTPAPTSVSLSLGQVRTQGSGSLPGGAVTRTASAFIGITPDASNRVLLWGTLGTAQPNILTPNLAFFDEDRTRLRSFQVGAGFSHTISHQNVVTAAVVAERGDQQQQRAETLIFPGPVFLVDTRLARRAIADTVTAATGHTVRFGDVTLRSGVEGAAGRARTRDETALTVVDVFGVDSFEAIDQNRTGLRTGRAYVNALWQPNDRWQVEGALAGSALDTTASDTRAFFTPRLGVSFAPLPSHWLRAMWRRDVESFSSFTLAPVTTAALLPHVLPAPFGTRSETFGARWDGEWSSTVFTAVEYQRQRFSALQVGVSDTLDSFSLGNSRLQTITAAANVWLPGGFGLSALVGAAESRTESIGGNGAIPFAPDRFARASLTYVHPSRIRVSLHENFYGRRRDAPQAGELPAFATTDMTASYELPNRALQFELAVLNVLDRRYNLMAARPDREAIPGSRRTISGVIRARF